MICNAIKNKKGASLRAQRSNPEKQKIDCFTLRVRNDETDKQKQQTKKVTSYELQVTSYKLKTTNNNK